MKVLITDPKKLALCKKVQKDQYLFEIILIATQISSTVTD